MSPLCQPSSLLLSKGRKIKTIFTDFCSSRTLEALPRTSPLKLGPPLQQERFTMTFLFPGASSRKTRLLLGEKLRWEMGWKRYSELQTS